MAWTIPNETRYTFKLHSKGIVVWAIQRGLKDLGHHLAVDGAYGRRTEGHVATFQEDEGLLSDGIFGPASSQRLGDVLSDEVSTPLPAHLITGFIAGESAGHIGAVNWSVPGGVDCSYVQRRVVSGDYSNDGAIQRAFNASYQFKLLGWALENRHDAFLGRPAAQPQEKAWRLAALQHNFPYAADKLSRGPWETPYSTSEQSWVADIGAHFDDGTRVRTPREWCDFYALGSQEHQHPGQVCRFVVDWTP